MLDQITPLILTYNEAPNIARTLEQLRWAGDIVVVDSFSDDETLSIIAEFPQARVFQRKFDGFAEQANFGLRETGITTEWVLSLDADYVLTPKALQEMEELSFNSDIAGYRANFVYCISGRRLRCGIYPPVTVLLRRSQARYQDDGHAHRVILEGRVADLHAAILHDDRKPLSRWFASQVSYTKLEARKLLTRDRSTLSWTDRIRLLRVVAPLAMLVYCLILRGGVLDGWAGWFYAFQRTIAETMLSLRLLEHDLNFSGSKRRELSRQVHSETVDVHPRD